MGRGTRLWKSDESGGISCWNWVDLHAIDDGSGLLIPIFAMLVSGQGQRKCGE